MDDDQTPIRLRSEQGSSGPTRLKCLSLKRVVGEATHVNIDVNTGVAFGPNADSFNNYFAVVSRERLSILINSLDDVSKVDRNMLWEDVHLRFTLLFLSYNAF